MRNDKRKNNELRKIIITRNFTKYAEGSVLIEFGETKVICTASVSNDVPPFLKGKGKGWVTAEYSMLPRATNTRNQRDASKGKVNARAQEIQRLIGRALRGIVDTTKLGERTITIDADVIQADGGTRTAAITGAYVALVDAVDKMLEKKQITTSPLKDSIAAVSVGIISGTPMLDLNYIEDSSADVDMNVVMTGAGKFVELQATGENSTFDDKQLIELLDLASSGIKKIMLEQKKALKTKKNTGGKNV
ncbi:MAG: ribonuclease PH [bacterium]